VIKAPDTAKMEDFQELMEFIWTLEEWNIKIILEFKWWQKESKRALSRLEELKEWIRRKWT
jgi:hypothetical protein